LTLDNFANLDKDAKVCYRQGYLNGGRMDTWHTGIVTRDTWTEQLVERFTTVVASRLASSMPHGYQANAVAIARQALSETIDAMGAGGKQAPARLPVAKLKAAEVISRQKVDLSQATLYRAADQGRFYTTTPAGRSIGKEFPVWQFVEPVPELIGAILARLANRSSSEVHAFWVTAADELNELSPAELLAGMPFETRAELHQSQQYLLDLPARLRQQKVEEFALQQSRSEAEVIG
jgi:hypothetical protein